MGGEERGERGGNEEMADKRMKVDAGAMVVWEGKWCKSRFGRTWHLRTVLVWGEGGGLGGGERKDKIDVCLRSMNGSIKSVHYH